MTTVHDSSVLHCAARGAGVSISTQDKIEKQNIQDIPESREVCMVSDCSSTLFLFAFSFCIKTLIKRNSQEERIYLTYICKSHPSDREAMAWIQDMNKYGTVCSFFTHFHNFSAYLLTLPSSTCTGMAPSPGSCTPLHASIILQENATDSRVYLIK